MDLQSFNNSLKKIALVEGILFLALIFLLALNYFFGIYLKVLIILVLVFMAFAVIAVIIDPDQY